VSKSFYMNKKHLLIFLFILLSQFSILNSVTAQNGVPASGVQDVRTEVYAFTNATIFTDYQTIISNATLIIEKGIIKQVGSGLKPPANAIVIDLKGKFIYPSFIDLSTSYGIAPNTKHDGHQPQYNTAVQGAYPVNEGIKSYQEAYKLFKTDHAKAEEYRKSGFGTVLSFQPDGFARGTGTLIALSSKKESESILLDRASAHYSLEKGTSSQVYPNSLMGYIAVLRQTFSDAKWYASTKEKKELNIGLEALNQSTTLPKIFDAGDKLNILRADKIGDEFGTQFIIKGSGNEYQKTEAIKATNATLIIPVNYPQAFDVEDPMDAEILTYTQMKHWEMASFNAYFLYKAQIPFAITSQGLKDRSHFLAAIRRATKAGLPEKEALKALTLTPATLIKADKKVGSLKPGMLANFLITSDSIFKDGSVIHENWVQGEKFVLHEIAKDTRGIYNFIITNQSGTKNLPDSLTLSIKGKIDNLEIELLRDSVKTKFNGKIDKNAILLTGEWKKLPFRLSGWQSNGKLYGIGEFNNGNTLKWSAQLDIKYQEPAITDSVKKAEVKQKFKDDSTFKSIGKLIYPFNAYGNEKLPKSRKVLFKNATVWTSESNGTLKETDVFIENGKIVKIGKNLIFTSDTTIDATGKHLTPGIIDEHSHIAINGGVNECSNSITAEVRIGDIINSENIDIYRNLAGGVTAVQVLHGSCNAIGGQSALIKLRWGVTPEEMKIKGAPGFIKFALGENVKQSNWGSTYTSRFPQTRMGVEQVYVDAFTRAREYEAKKKTNPETRIDLQMETVLEIINSKRFVTCHSYVQSEIIMMMRVAEQFGFRMNTFTHILEGYKVADKMKAHGVGASTFADWWAYKMEVKDAIPYNAAILTKMGVVTAINSDDGEMARRLNQEAAKTIKYGGISEEEALKMVTLNPAKLLHIDNITGSIKEGKDADLVLWSENPLSIYAKCEQTYVDGVALFDLNKDQKMQEYIQKDRKRLISKLLEAKKKSEPTQKPVINNERRWDCETNVMDYEY
jgi:imidazolonepropionase-like amidohydrolase